MISFYKKYSLTFKIVKNCIKRSGTVGIGWVRGREVGIGTVETIRNGELSGTLK